MDPILDKKSYLNLRKAVWEMYMGPGVLEGKCLLCEKQSIQSNVNSGFQACHIVARRYSQHQVLTRYDLLPGCAGCNNECHDTCLLDYLWLRFRFRALRRIILAVYNAFILEHGANMPLEDKMSWKVLDHLYGSQRFPVGCILNTNAIYQLARSYEVEQIVEETTLLTRKLEESAKRLTALLSSNIVTMRIM